MPFPTAFVRGLTGDSPTHVLPVRRTGIARCWRPLGVWERYNNHPWTSRPRDRRHQDEAAGASATVAIDRA